MSRLLQLLLVLPLAGCIASPQPSPPNLHPDALEYFAPSPTSFDSGRVRGVAGAVDLSEGVVVLTNLDEELPLGIEPVQPDGSFDVVVWGEPGSEHRLSARLGAARSVPLDFGVDDGAMALRPVAHPLDCLIVTPAFELDFGPLRVGESRALPVSIENGCEVEVTLAAPRTRELASPFTVEGEATALRAGESVVWTVRAEVGATGTFEGTVFVEASAPMRDRRPLTCFVQGT